MTEYSSLDMRRLFLSHPEGYYPSCLAQLQPHFFEGHRRDGILTLFSRNHGNAHSGFV